MLIKVSNNKQYLEDLCNGRVYMNESGYFRKLEDTFRGDKFEGRYLISFKNLKKEFIELVSENNPKERIKIPVQAVKSLTLGFEKDDKIPLFCCSQISESILIKESETSLRFREEFISEMEQFGSYYILFSKIEFLQNMLEYIHQNNIGGKWGPVSYVDIQSEYSTNILCDDNRNQYNVFFQKDKSYFWQSEWRILLASNNKSLIDTNEHYYIAKTKSLNWFHIGDIQTLRDATIELVETDN